MLLSDEDLKQIQKQANKDMGYDWILPCLREVQRRTIEACIGVVDEWGVRDKAEKWDDCRACNIIEKLREGMEPAPPPKPRTVKGYRWVVKDFDGRPFVTEGYYTEKSITEHFTNRIISRLTDYSAEVPATD